MLNQSQKRAIVRSSIDLEKKLNDIKQINLQLQDCIENIDEGIEQIKKTSENQIIVNVKRVSFQLNKEINQLKDKMSQMVQENSQTDYLISVFNQIQKYREETARLTAIIEFKNQEIAKQKQQLVNLVKENELLIQDVKSAKKKLKFMINNGEQVVEDQVNIIKKSISPDQQKDFLQVLKQFIKKNKFSDKKSRLKQFCQSYYKFNNETINFLEFFYELDQFIYDIEFSQARVIKNDQLNKVNYQRRMSTLAAESTLDYSVSRKNSNYNLNQLTITDDCLKELKELKQIIIKEQNPSLNQDELKKKLNLIQTLLEKINVATEIATSPSNYQNKNLIQHQLPKLQQRREEQSNSKQYRYNLYRFYQNIENKQNVFKLESSSNSKNQKLDTSFETPANINNFSTDFLSDQNKQDQKDISNQSNQY